MDATLGQGAVVQDVSSLPTAVTDYFEAQMGKSEPELPVLPDVAAKLLSDGMSEESDIRRLSEMIHRDPALAGHVLRVANSAFYCSGTAIASLQQAILRLGFAQLREIVIAVAVHGKIFRAEGFAGEMAAIWRHSAVTSGFAKEIARVRRTNVEAAFLCGLLHDIGKPIILTMLSDLLRNKDLVWRPEYTQGALAAFHTRVGGMLAERWKLPPQVVSAISCHHQPAQAKPDPDSAFVACLANLAAHLAFEPHDCSEEELRAHPSLVALNIYPDDLDGVLNKTEAIRQFADSFHASGGSRPSSGGVVLSIRTRPPAVPDLAAQHPAPEPSTPTPSLHGMGAGTMARDGPPPALPAVALDPKPRLEPDDLNGDLRLQTAPRVLVNGKFVAPALGGIPLLRRLGQGAMGAVFYAIHPRLQKEVAVKVLSPHLVDEHPDLRSRFYREARIAARIHSPHLVSVLDVNQDGGLCYLVMEFVHGRTARRCLDEVLDAGREGLDERSALEICAAAGKGLETAHYDRIVHRDVKPENILIPFAAGPEPDCAKAKLTDLGIARSDEVKDGLTGSRMTLGTPGFMAPEQITNTRQAGPAADVFGMAATLYALLAGRPPFKGSTAFETAMATVQTPHTPIAQVRGEISRPTGALLEQALQKDPVRRPACGAVLVKALETCLEALGREEPAQELAVRRIEALCRIHGSRLPQEGQG